MKGERCPNDPFAYQSREKSSYGTDRSLSLNLDQMSEYKLNSGHINQLWHFMCLLYHTIRYWSIWPTDLCSSLPVIPASIILCCFTNYTCYWYWLRSLQLTLALVFFWGGAELPLLGTSNWCFIFVPCTFIMLTIWRLTATIWVVPHN